jgi:hypothetical protein
MEAEQSFSAVAGWVRCQYKTLGLFALHWGPIIIYNFSPLFSWKRIKWGHGEYMVKLSNTVSSFMTILPHLKLE